MSKSYNDVSVSSSFVAIRDILLEGGYPLIVSARRSSGEYNGYKYDNLVINTLDASSTGIFAGVSKMPFSRVTLDPTEYVGRHARLSYDRFGKLLSIELVGEE